MTNKERIKEAVRQSKNFLKEQEGIEGVVVAVRITNKDAINLTDFETNQHHLKDCIEIFQERLDNSSDKNPMFY